jgi:hypothetical protein
MLKYLPLITLLVACNPTGPVKENLSDKREATIVSADRLLVGQSASRPDKKGGKDSVQPWDNSLKKDEWDPRDPRKQAIPSRDFMKRCGGDMGRPFEF